MPSVQATSTPPAPEKGGRAIPVHAKVIAILIFFGVLAAVIELIELASPGIGWRYLKLWGIPVALLFWPLTWRVIRRIYGEQRVKTEKQLNVTREAKYRRWFFRYFLPPLAVLFAVLGGMDTGPAWHAWHGEGRRGWAVAEVLTCDKTCSWTGSFRSDDGAVVRADVWIWDPPDGARVGDRVRALDTGDRTAVFEESGDGARREWWLAFGFLAFGVLYLVWWLGWVSGFWRILFHKGDDLF